MTRARPLILVVDDDPSIRQTLARELALAGYDAVVAADGLAGAELFAERRPDLVITDLAMPRADGFALLSAVRRADATPVLVLSVRGEEEDKVRALDLGADDYVTKPFSAPELLARVRAALRRNARGSEHSPALRFADWTVDLVRRETRGRDGEQHLTPLEYRVLECLARHAGLIVTQNQLIRQVWGPERLGDTRSLRVCIKNLRAKLEPDSKRPQYLVTEPGLGYRLRTEDDGATSEKRSVLPNGSAS